MIQNRIVKTELIEWSAIKSLQPNNLKSSLVWFLWINANNTQMARGDHNRGKKFGKPFSTENQPTPESKAGKKRIVKFREALDFLSKIKRNEIYDTELTLESNIAFVLMAKANNGDINAIKLLIDVLGLNAPTKSETTIKGITEIIIEPKEM